MPLTPADVRNKQFSTTRLRPGYDEEEVDAFLDEVEHPAGDQETSSTSISAIASSCPPSPRASSVTSGRAGCSWTR